LIQRIPVYLLTGYLGSGKTSLLKVWLEQPELAGAALVINELGEVGLDNQLLHAAAESSTLIANACVCCTGLPGLTDALEGLFWARLEKRIPRFPCVVIETTGLAEPAPVLKALMQSELLAERFEIAGVITCISAASAQAVLAQFSEARAQLAGADVLVLTKTDLVDSALIPPLFPSLLNYNSAVKVLTSANVDLSAKEVLTSLKQRFELESIARSLSAGAHHHGAKAFWWPIAEPISENSLQERIAGLHLVLGHSLIRLKGLVMTDQGLRWVQFSPFDQSATITSALANLESNELSGVTFIVSLPLKAVQMDYVAGLCEHPLRTSN
jgi:G3E family GTPase